MKHRLFIILTLALLATGCATATKSSGAGAGDSDSNLLTTAQIDASGLPNAYELVSRLRRAWLRNDPVTGGPVTVYMDDREIGGAEKLREIPAVTIAELRLVRNEEAIMRWSPSIRGSVIVVVPRR